MTSSVDPTSLFRLDGKVALVTGGSRGLGREMIQAYAADRPEVVIASRRKGACEKVAGVAENQTAK